MPRNHNCPEECFQGSTDFYDTTDTDQFTPSTLEAGLLVDNVGTRQDGSIPPWIDRYSTLSPIEQYVRWFNTIWHTGDPSGWNASVFTDRAVMIDPSGVSIGAKQAAANFLLIFKYYPDLRGEVVSWAANDREIFINWRFRILPAGSKTPMLVAVVDKFCFVDGRVSFRLANFDIITLTAYLSEYYGHNQLYDFLSETLRHAQKTGGIQLLPTMLWNLLKGAFLWPPPPAPASLSVTPGDGRVELNWEPIDEAVAYSLSRATAIAGPFESLRDVCDTSYVDETVINGTTYWYIVSPKFKKLEPMPATKAAPFRSPPSRRVRWNQAGHAGLG